LLLHEFSSSAGVKKREKSNPGNAFSLLMELLSENDLPRLRTSAQPLTKSSHQKMNKKKTGQVQAGLLNAGRMQNPAESIAGILGLGLETEE